VIAMVYEEPSRIPRLYGVDDLPWIAKLVDLAVQSVGEPWRVLVERVEHAPLGVHTSHRTAMLQALRRVLGGAGPRARIARQIRALVLGPPALDPVERAARLAKAAAEFGTTAEDIESLLWSDLAMERPVALPDGRLVRLTVSIGIATYPTHANSFDELIKRADEALYWIKSHGRNRIRLYSTEIPAKT